MPEIDGGLDPVLYTILLIALALRMLQWSEGEHSRVGMVFSIRVGRGFADWRV